MGIFYFPQNGDKYEAPTEHREEWKLLFAVGRSMKEFFSMNLAVVNILNTRIDKKRTGTDEDF